MDIKINTNTQTIFEFLLLCVLPNSFSATFQNLTVYPGVQFSRKIKRLAIKNHVIATTQLKATSNIFVKIS